MPTLFEKSPRIAFGAALFAAALSQSAAVSAASACKGLVQDACVADSQCAWINGYVRKDGRTVASHCKLKPARGDADRAAVDAVKLGQAR